MNTSYHFDKCLRCRLNCELAQEHQRQVQNNSEHALPLYATRDMGRCVVGEYFNPIPCGSEFISDGIGDDYKVDWYFNEDSTKVTFISGDKTKWKPERPVCISAQTGRGKNHFVENELLPYIEALNEDKRTALRVLIVSNRIALRRQIEYRLSGKGNHDDEHEDERVYHYKSCADVVSYQGLIKRADYLRSKQEHSRSKYIFVVCDEAHFFTSDSMFNPHTAKILSAIVDIFKNTIRIYMTATPYECLPFIAAYERNELLSANLNKCEHQKRREEFLTDTFLFSKMVSADCYGSISLNQYVNDPRFWVEVPAVFYEPRENGLFYHFARDYSYLDIEYFSNYDDLINIIQNSGREKWLVFLDNINSGEKFKEQLESADSVSEESTKKASKGADKKSKYYAVNARSKEDETYQEIIQSESLGDIQVLITTSVVDNGVNFRNIKNVVVSDISRVKCMQMLGRARVSDGQRVTLYIKRLNAKFMQKRLDSFETQRDAYRAHGLYDKDNDNNQIYAFLEKYYGEGAITNNCCNFKNASHWFGRDRRNPNKLYRNDIAHLMLGEMVPIYESIRDEMIETDTNGIVTGQKYLEYQLEWFGNEYDTKTDIDVDNALAAKDELIAFLESHVGKQLLFNRDKAEDETAPFRMEITPLLDKVFPGENPNRTIHSIDKIKRLLDGTGFILESTRASKEDASGKKPTFWKVTGGCSSIEQI